MHGTVGLTGYIGPMSLALSLVRSSFRPLALKFNFFTKLKPSKVQVLGF